MKYLIGVSVFVIVGIGISHILPIFFPSISQYTLGFTAGMLASVAEDFAVRIYKKRNNHGKETQATFKGEMV